MKRIRHTLSIGAALTLLPIASAADRGATVPMDKTLAGKGLDAALMCQAVYSDDLGVCGWEGPFYEFEGKDFRMGGDGLSAAIYWRARSPSFGPSEAFLAFRGTDFDELNDWVTNLTNFFGGVPPAFLEAGEWAQAAVAKIHAAKFEKFTVTGHSLGGAQAVYCGMLVGHDAIGFGSAALGPGLIDRLVESGAQGIGRTDTFVHFFMQGDIVPSLTGESGIHFGRLATPALRLPEGYADATSAEQKLAYLVLAGLLLDKPLKAGQGVASQYLKETHGIDKYIASLSSFLTPERGFSPAGVWTSRGSFFDLTANETRFRFNTNGTFVILNDFNLLSALHLKLRDKGTWTFADPNLVMHIPGFATMTYQLAAGEGEHTTQWIRKSMVPDLQAVRTAQTEEDRRSAKTAAGLAGAVLKVMEGKTVMWQRATTDQPDVPLP